MDMPRYDDDIMMAITNANSRYGAEYNPIVLDDGSQYLNDDGG